MLNITYIIPTILIKNIICSISTIYILAPLIAFVLIAIIAYLIIKQQKNKCNIYKTQIVQQENQIAGYEQVVKDKQNTLDEIAEEYESTINDLKSSIKYAERIQRAAIPQNAEFKALFNNSFIYFSPRDIVSGDFYTCAKLPNNKIVIVADCTGHGVPGGFLSMLGLSALKDILSKQKNAKQVDPSNILNLLRKFILSSLAESSETDNTIVSDGMDISLCAFNNDFTQISYAAANHTIYVCRNGEAIKLKGNRMPIGRHPKQDEPFNTFTFNIEKGDMVYLCSDGIQDQFGTPEDIKFTTKRLAEMLAQHSNEDLETQFANISQIVDNWKKGYEQYDDQTLIGIRI